MEYLLHSGNNKLSLISLALVCIYAAWREIRHPIGDEISKRCQQLLHEVQSVFQPQPLGHALSHANTANLQEPPLRQDNNKNKNKVSDEVEAEDTEAGAAQASVALEVYQVAFSFLSAKELNVCAQVCFHWRDASRADEIWKPRVAQVLGEKYLGNGELTGIMQRVFECTAQHDTLVRCVDVPRRLHQMDWKQFLAVTRMLARSSGSGKSVVYDRGNVYPHQILQLAARIAAGKEPQNVVSIIDRFIDIYANLGAQRWSQMNARAGFRFANGQNCSVAEFRMFVAKTGITMAGLKWFWTQPRRRK